MVHIKVSNGVETRKFQVTGELTLEQLREKLVAIGLFSSTVDETLHLRYRDSEGDVITISSDEELKISLSGLSDDAVLKLHVHIKKPTAPRGHRQSLFKEIFGQSTNFWDQFQKQFNTTESILEQLWGNSGRESSCCNTVCCDPTTEQNRTEPSDEQVKSKSDTVWTLQVTKKSSQKLMKNQSSQSQTKAKGVLKFALILCCPGNPEYSTHGLDHALY